MLSAAIVAGTLPVGFATGEPENGVVSEEGVKKTVGIVFYEDFEDDTVYPVGVVADNTDGTSILKGRIGYVDYSLRPGTKIEIAEDENGNKDVVVSGVANSYANQPGTEFDFNFDKAYGGGQVEYSYDFLPVKNTVFFQSFGELRDEENGTLERTLNCSETLYRTQNTSEKNIVWSKNALKAADTTTWRKISKTVNFEAESGNSVTMETKLGATSEAYTHDYPTSTIEALKKIHFEIKEKFWFSPTGSANWNVGGANNEGKPFEYHYDNICVEDKTLISDSFKKVTLDFERYPEAEFPAGMSDYFYFDTKVDTGDKIEVATDPQTGSKALKITKGESELESYVRFNFGNITDKAVKLTYDVRFENHSRLLRYFPQVAGSNWAFYKNAIYWKKVGSGLMAGKISNSAQYTRVENNYIPIEEGIAVTAKILNADGTVTESSFNSAQTSFSDVYFGVENAISGGKLNVYTSHMGTSQGDGVYWIDNISVEIMELKLQNSNIKPGETEVPANKKLILTFNEAVAENVKDSITVKKGIDELQYGEDYTVDLSADSKTVTVAPKSGKWSYDTTYEVSISEVSGAYDIPSYKGTVINFVTGKYSPVLVNDDFSDLVYNGEKIKLGDKWTGPQTLNFINQNQGTSIKVILTDSDTIEYAHDPARNKNGFKLIKGTTKNEDGTAKTENMEFNYNFPESYTEGKFEVTVNTRIQNHSKAHTRWPALNKSHLTQGEGLEKIWINSYGTGYYGAYEGIYDVGKSYRDDVDLIGTASLGAKTVKYGMYNNQNGTSKSLEKGREISALGGVMLKIVSREGNYPDSGQFIYLGNQVDTDTVNNPNNNDISWVYSVKVEEILLAVTNTSFEESQLEFDPTLPLTVTFNEPLDIETVSVDTIKLYKGDNLIDAYEYTVNLSEDGKTVTLAPVAGLDFGTNYTIKISQDVKPVDASLEGLKEEKNYTIKTIDYIDAVNPDIIWSTIPDGSKNVDYKTENIILTTDNVLLDAETVTKENIKVYKNGVETDAYEVALEGKYAIKVTFDGLEKSAEYSVKVSGLKSGGDNALEMTEEFALSFTTRDDIYVDSVVSKISADGTKSVITGELFNKSEENTAYQIVGVLRGATGNILSIVKGSTGNVAVNDVAEITVEAPVNSSATAFDLYIWDGIGTMKPLVKKNTLSPVNERTYGYDNFIDPQKPLKIGFIGGSITQQEKYTNPLSTSLTDFLRTENPERKIEYVYKGIGGTGSNLGVFRLEKDIINYNPDIVFIEFAVNDASNGTARVKTMEGMIRKLMKLDHQPMVILLNVTTENHGSLESIVDFDALAKAYGIGSVNVAEYLIANEASAENPDGFVWKKAYLADYPEATALTDSDGTHPNSVGGKIYADYMYSVISANPGSFFKKMTYVKDVVNTEGFEYRNPRMVSWKAAQYDENWRVDEGQNWAFYEGQAKATEAGATLTFKFTGSTIGLYLPNWNGATDATYSIDNGAYTGTVSGNNSGITTKMPMMRVIKNDLPAGEHTITITAKEAADINFTFGYFVVD